MARVFLPFAAETINDLMDAVNTALTPLTTKALWSVQVQAIDQTRYLGREYQMVITYDDGGAVLLSPYQIMGFEGTNADDVISQLNTWVAAHPAYWVSPVFTVALPANRYDRKQCAIVFYSTDAVNAALNWLVNGSAGGGGGGDHSTLVNRSSVDQHPARAVNYDSITDCPDATVTLVDAVLIDPTIGAAVCYEFYAVDVANPDTSFTLGRFSSAVGPAAGTPQVSRMDFVTAGGGVPELVLSADISGNDLQFVATVAGLAGGAKLAWRRINMTPPI